jgi:hypothetical protein
MPIPEKVIIPAAKDPGRGHFYVSLSKSAIRIAAGVFLIQGNIVGAGLLLIGAELLGVIEELV